eukprot:Ihof_evm6s407 gene=Ihof_evmTU6s407
MLGLSRLGCYTAKASLVVPAMTQAVRNLSQQCSHIPSDAMTRTHTNTTEIKPRTWTVRAIQEIRADQLRSSDTHLHKIAIPSVSPNIRFYIKDESTHPTGSLKHRLARSLLLYGLCNGDITETTTVIESSSGSTAISEAYFCRLLGLPFIAVVPSSIQKEKREAIEFWGGKCHMVDDGSKIYSESQRLEKELGGYYIDQFTNAEKATDWKGNNNIAQSTLQQMKLEPFPVPKWIVVGAGTGGTATTLARHCRYAAVNTAIAVVDPENSVFFEHYLTGEGSITSPKGSNIEGIGRPRVEPSFTARLVDCMMRIPDAASFSAMRFLTKVTGMNAGPSSGCNLYGSLKLMAEMNNKGEKGSLVTLLCDSGARYQHTAYND